MNVISRPMYFFFVLARGNGVIAYEDTATMRVTGLSVLILVSIVLLFTILFSPPFDCVLFFFFLRG